MESTLMLPVVSVLSKKQWITCFSATKKRVEYGKTLWPGLVIVGSPPHGPLRLIGSSLKQRKKAGGDVFSNLPLQK